MTATRQNERESEGPSGMVAPAAVRETNTSVVLLMGDRAYKIKKAVDLGFLDFRPLEARRSACHREMELNRRLAPDVYLAVADVLDAAGQVCEHVVVMRRMPENRRLATLVLAGVDVRDDLRNLARSIAALHAGALTSPEVAACGHPRALRDRWCSNLRGLRDHRVPQISSEVLDRIETLALRYISGRSPLLASRVAGGLIRDGHGDLLADDIFCLADGPRALDCLEFDDRLRWMDVLDDVACLAADLERLGAPDAADDFLAAYAEFSGTPQPATLRHHYMAYRSVMRAKVAAIRATTTSGADTDEQGEQAGLLCRLAVDHLERARVRLIMVGGPPAAGKSTLASSIADRLDAVVLRSDELRKQIHGLHAGQHAPAAFEAGIYAADATGRTYSALARRARGLLEMGECVVVDASFTREEQRDPLRKVAAETSADLSELRCTAPMATLHQRLLARQAHPDQYSDAGSDVGLRLAAAAEPWPAAVDVNTAGSMLASTAQALHALAVTGS